jgi:ubiquinone/menaquinone biosynthesis C-methylase UbiE
MTDEHTEAVRRGYDALSVRYRADDAAAGQYGPWLASLDAALPRGARVLDVGCGCGVPVARELSAAGHSVTGVDVSDVQIARARTLVPGASFVRADVTTLTFEPGSFDAIVALYSIIHVPLAAQPALLGSFARWLCDGGSLLMTAGWRAWTGTEDGWLGGDATMWWSHADVVTYRAWLASAGFEITAEAFVPEGSSGHSLFRAVRP